jgi:hypothetical protein
MVFAGGLALAVGGLFGRTAQARPGKDQVGETCDPNVTLQPGWWRDCDEGEECRDDTKKCAKKDCLRDADCGDPSLFCSKFKMGSMGKGAGGCVQGPQGTDKSMCQQDSDCASGYRCQTNGNTYGSCASTQGDDDDDNTSTTSDNSSSDDTSNSNQSNDDSSKDDSSSDDSSSDDNSAAAAAPPSNDDSSTDDSSADDSSNDDSSNNAPSNDDNGNSPAAGPPPANSLDPSNQ